MLTSILKNDYCTNVTQLCGQGHVLFLWPQKCMVKVQLFVLYVNYWIIRMECLHKCLLFSQKMRPSLPSGDTNRSSYLSEISLSTLIEVAYKIAIFNLWF